ncbi:MAG: GNAT family N-acetyltransferase [Desulfobacteraceae bacterium]
MGYYFVCPASVEFARTPAVVKWGLARYDVPVFHLCRLAVDRPMQSKGLGGQLLLSAGQRCIKASQDVGGVALLIDAKNNDAARWYAGYGAIPLQDNPLAVVLPLSTIQRTLFSAGIKTC